MYYNIYEGAKTALRDIIVYKIALHQINDDSRMALRPCDQNCRLPQRQFFGILRLSDRLWRPRKSRLPYLSENAPLSYNRNRIVFLLYDSIYNNMISYLYDIVKSYFNQ